MSEKTSSEKTTKETNTLLSLAAQVVSAYVGNNPVTPTELTALLSSVYNHLTHLDANTISPETRPDPAVPVKKSITPDYIVCLEDGKKLKMLKRHIKTVYNLTPDQYRDRWKLPADYPMVAPNYAKQRSKLAKQIGLGTGQRAGRKAA